MYGSGFVHTDSNIMFPKEHQTSYIITNKTATEYDLSANKPRPKSPFNLQQDMDKLYTTAY